MERDKNKVGAPGGRNHQTREENDCFLQLINHRQSPAMRQTIANHYRSYAVIVETRLLAHQLQMVTNCAADCRQPCYRPSLTDHMTIWKPGLTKYTLQPIFLSCPLYIDIASLLGVEFLSDGVYNGLATKKFSIKLRSLFIDYSIKCNSKFVTHSFSHCHWHM